MLAFGISPLELLCVCTIVVLLASGRRGNLRGWSYGHPFELGLLAIVVIGVAIAVLLPLWQNW